MNPLARFSAIINPQNLIMIVSLIIRCIMRLLVFQCVQNLRVDRPLTRYPERGYELMGTGYSGSGMLRQRTTNRPQRTALEGLLPLLLWSC